MCARGITPAERHLQDPNRQGRPALERRVLLAEAIECRQRGLQRAIQVVANRDDPGDGQLRSALEIRIVDALLESLETLERDQGAVVVTNLDGGNGRYQ